MLMLLLMLIALPLLLLLAPGVTDLIAAAQAQGLPVAVASSGAPPKLERNLRASGLAPLIQPQLVVSAAHVAKVICRLVGRTGLYCTALCCILMSLYLVQHA